MKYRIYKKEVNEVKFKRPEDLENAYARKSEMGSEGEIYGDYDNEKDAMEAFGKLETIVNEGYYGYNFTVFDLEQDPDDEEGKFEIIDSTGEFIFAAYRGDKSLIGMFCSEEEAEEAIAEEKEECEELNDYGFDDGDLENINNAYIVKWN